jgi:hypothetical protein
MDKTYKDFPVTKNLNGSYTITAVFDGQELPYNVCKDDAGCKFDYEEVATYWDSLADDDEKKLTEKDIVIPEPTADEKKAAALAELDAKYKSDKEELASQYLDAAMSGDSDTMNAIKEEAAALNAKYDSDYASLNK